MGGIEKVVASVLESPTPLDQHAMKKLRVFIEDTTPQDNATDAHVLQFDEDDTFMSKWLGQELADTIRQGLNHRVTKGALGAFFMLFVILGALASLMSPHLVWSAWCFAS